MNIAIFSPSQNPYSETFIQAHKNGLKGNIFYYYGIGLNIQLEGVEELMPNFRYKRLRVYAKLTKKSSSFLWQRRLLYSIKQNKVDKILVEYGTHAFHLLEVLKQAKISVIVHFHGYDASVNSVIQRCNNYKEVFHIANRVIAVSRVMESKLLELGCPEEKLVYNVYGPQKLFENVQPNFTKKQFIAIGRFTNKKAPYYTILAFKEVLKRHPDAILLFAGQGELMNTCENLICYFNLGNNVKLLGVISPERYTEILSESLAFVQHSITAKNGDMEGTPLAVLEASVAGLPVISTKHAGIPDVILHEQTGLLCEEHDVDAMIMNMLRLLDDIDLTKKMGAAGKLHVLQNYSVERHLDVLQKMLEIN